MTTAVVKEQPTRNGSVYYWYCHVCGDRSSPARWDNEAAAQADANAHTCRGAA